MLFSNLIAQHELVAKGKGCSGINIDKGIFATIEMCAEECKNLSSMFQFGRNGTGGCTTNGCACYCETAASADGTCDQKDKDYVNLYRYTKKGDILFI